MVIKAETNSRKNKIPYILWVTKDEEELLNEAFKNNDYENLREAVLIIDVFKDNYKKGDFKKL